MGKNRDLFKKIGDIKGIFHARMGIKKNGNGNSLHYSCLGNMDGGAWQAIIHGVTKSQTLLSMQAKKIQNRKPRRGQFPSTF